MVDVFFVLGGDAPRDRLFGLMTELRRRGLKAEMDFAERSLKGQFTQASRLKARTIIVAAEEGATVRRFGEPDRVVPYDPDFVRLKQELGVV